MSVTRQLAQNIIAIAKSDFPQVAMDMSKLAVLDTLGVLLAGSVHEGATKLRQVILPTAAAGPALAFGTDLRLNVLDAALLNGTAGHMLDFDDSNSQFRGHPSVAILPALLAAAEEKEAAGHDILRAYIVGFETGARIGMGAAPFQYTSGWHPTTTIGIFAAVAAVSVLRGLDEDQITTALGIAASMSAGIKSNFGSMTKPLAVGQAARNALLAVSLAQMGFTASEKAFDHPHGYLNVYNRGADHYDLDRILSGWGDPLCVLDLGIKQKRFPCCYACLPPIDGMQELVERHRITPAEVAAIDVAVHPIRFPHVNVPDPKSSLDAKFSVHYCVSRILMNGTLTLEDFEGDRFRDPATRQLMARVSFSTYASENLGGAEVRVTKTDGAVLAVTIESALGASYDHPLPADLVHRKFQECAMSALPRHAVEALYSLLTRFDDVADIREVTSLAIAGAVRPGSTTRTSAQALAS